MEYLAKIPTYHRSVILLYIVITPLLIFFWKDGFSYDIRSGNLAYAIIIAVVSVFLFLWLLNVKRNSWNRSCSTVTIALTYALLFAIPEEIIFRGIVQGSLGSYLDNAILAVILSSAIFGLAHIYNGAKGPGLRSSNWQLVGLTFLAGLPLGTIYVLTDSLLLPTVLHAFLVFCLKLTEEKS